MVRTAEQALLFTPPAPDRLSFVATPCTPAQEIREIVAVLRRRFPTHARQHHAASGYVALRYDHVVNG
ncbi:hypothetical protein ABZY31_12655 [Streptomyces sp. NPDC006529]|uniref:hypothetical protein n=1 Tax=Streptomyces sp. NPDC006529 TaxID=3157177 RepID=UPI0033BB0F3F